MNILRNPDPLIEKFPSKKYKTINERKLVQLAFHDCLRYQDGTGGCDGCLNYKEMWKILDVSKSSS